MRLCSDNNMWEEFALKHPTKTLRVDLDQKFLPGEMPIYIYAHIIQ